jgi:PAS domain S-box-containing protein
MMVRLMLWNRLQIFLWWGPHFVQMYNDASWPALGTKHPRSMGQAASECWAEIWHIIGPLIEAPFGGGQATWMEDIFLEMNRKGFMEETHWTIAYSSVLDEMAPGGIGGVIGTVNEITEKVVGERRVLLLRDLGARASEAKNAEDACVIAAETMNQHREDVPFALLYLVSEDRRKAHLAGAAGVAVGQPESPMEVDLQRGAAEPVWPLAEALLQEQVQLVEELGSKLSNVPPGPWSDPPRSAVVCPVRSNIAHQLAGLLILGVSSRLSFDDRYRGFCDLVSGQIATAIANARAYEEERKRAEALAEIDRAKTQFFSNVSHEFRTPLTLMLGPIEEMLSRGNGTVSIPRHELELVHRNCLRLLKLVNALLDFSRIEAGRALASYEAVDLPTFTAELASMFRATIEKAGLRLKIDCPRLDQPVYVDRAMWEKIVLNLLSNAFKFTFEGEITVALKQLNQHVELSVADTGTGIAQDELPRVFERFHRIEGARGRTFEGSGIGLALVQELARLHGGDVEVVSTYGKGTQFTVSIPMGRAHLPASRTEPARVSHNGVDAYVQEALRWLPDTDIAAPPGPVAAQANEVDKRRTILFADDNADLRQYVQRLLSADYEVKVVPDGEDALAAARHTAPDLVLSDVMMPRLDGFGLLKALRDDPATRNIPVILLSARAGEESRVEGLSAGATDYLMKPFSAVELLARIRNCLNLAAENLKAQRSLYTLVENSPDFIGFAEINGKALYVNPAGRQLVGLTEDDVKQTDPLDYVFEDDRELLKVGLATALEAGTWEAEVCFRNFKTGAIVPMFQHIFLVKESNGEHIGLATISRDLTERKRFEDGLRDAQMELARFSRVASMGELTASIAHEINQPVSAIVANAGACMGMLASRSPDLEEVRLAVKDIADSGRRASEVVSRIRGLLNKSHSEKCRLAINEVIAEVLPLMRGELDKYQTKLYTELQVDLPPVMGDRIELQQVLINLLLNGMEAMVSVSDRPRTITVSSQIGDSGAVVVAVRDSGVGLPANKSRAIFDAFFTTKQGGMGMGLAISRTIIDSHGGQLWAAPNQSGGTTFQFALSAAA